MNGRRHLLQAAASTLFAPALSAPALLLGRSAGARPADAADFAAAAAGQPLLTPLFGVDDHSGDRDGQARTLGRWPAQLRGRFYRNGPALLQRQGQRYHHWFDGDGMVQQFSIADGRVSHRGRLVRTSKLKAEREAGRFIFSSVGTELPDQPPATGPDSYNTANTNVIAHGGQLLALWEGGSAYAIDPLDLSTRGPVSWRADLAQMPFSAHPKVDAQGHLWNIGSSGRNLIVWHINPAGKLQSVQVTDSPFPGGMVHDLAITASHIVVPLPPLRLGFGEPTGGGPRRFPFVPGEPLRILVMHKDDISRQRIFELPAQLVFHVGNAFETAGGDIVLSYVGAPDASFMDQGAVALMAGRRFEHPPSKLFTAELSMATGRVRRSLLSGTGGPLEFPRMHPARIGLPARWLSLCGAWAHQAERPLEWFHGVQLIDTRSGRVLRYDYGAHAIAEEHIWIPKPRASTELDAWLLGTHFDARRQVTVLNLLDAAHIEDGPIAQAVLPYVMPLGFHGNFTAL